MRRYPRLLGALLLALVSARAVADGQSYMSLVGELYGAVEFPRMLRDYCGAAQPDTKDQVAAQYESWADRNSAFLKRAREQFARADLRLKDEGASLAQAEGALQLQFDSVGPARVCGTFAALLKAKEEQFGGEIGRLLEEVEFADAELAKRQRKP